MRHLLMVGLLSGAGSFPAILEGAEGVSLIWHSQPAAPGQTVMLYGDGLKDASLNLARLEDSDAGSPGAQVDLPAPAPKMPLLQPRTNCAKFVLPGDLPPGVFAVKAEAGAGRDLVLLNGPQVWWAQGDLGLEASPGGWVRAFGTCLGWKGIEKPLAGTPPGSPKTTVLLRGPKGLRLPAEADLYSAKAVLPSDTLEGKYQVYVHNGCGGSAAWSEGVPIRVRRPEAWLERKVNVKQFGAVGDGKADDTASVQSALDRVGATGGGVVFFPNGNYRLNNTLTIPPRVALRGEGREVAHLFWTRDQFSRLEQAVLGSHHFGLEDLTLSFVGANNGIVSDMHLTAQGNVFLRRLRVRWTLYGGKYSVQEGSRLQEETLVGDGWGTRHSLLFLAGPNIRIQDCDLYSSALGAWLERADGAIITGNTFWSGRMGYVLLLSGRMSLWENNRMIGADNATRAGIFLEGRPNVDQIYFARNDVGQANFWDMETFCTDQAMPQYFGPVAGATPTSVSFPRPVKWQTYNKGGPLAQADLLDSPHEQLLFVMAGRGRGQYRRIESASPQSVIVEKPFRVVPDATSIVGINHSIRDWLVVGNRFSDGNWVALYGIGFNVLFAENLVERNSKGLALVGMWHGKQGPGNTEPDYFVQFLDNRIPEARRFDNRWPRAGDAHLLAAASGITVMSNPYPNPPRDWPYPFVAGCVIRNNELRGGGIELGVRAPAGAPMIEDTVIEGNRLRDCSQGIVVPDQTAGIFLRDNHFADVMQPLSGAGLKDAWLHPAEAFLARLEAVRTALRTEGKTSPEEIARIEVASRDLLRRPAADLAMKQLCQELMARARQRVAREQPSGHSAELLEALLGLKVALLGDSSSLEGLLNRAEGGTGDLVFSANLGEDGPPLTVTFKPQWRPTWEPGLMVLSGTVKPAETIRLKMPVKVPTGSWGRHRLPVVVEVAWEGEKLEASFVANLGAAYITEWMVLGPFSRTDKESPEASPGSGLSRVEMDKPTRRFAGLDPAVHPPETRLDLKAEYDGVHGKIRWLPLSRTQYSPNLGPLLGNPQMGTAYALAAVRASEETLARLWLTNLIGDAGQVWVNGKELRELRGTLGWGTSSTIRLRQGDNIILVKVTTRKGNWSLGLAVEDGNPEAGGRLQLVPAKELPGIRSDQIAEKEG